MIVPVLLEELRSRDVQVWAEGDQLRCNAPAGVLTPVLRDELRQRKSDIVEFLRSAEALARQERAIVPLQARGGRDPVFAVAGHNGDVFCYRALAAQLGGDQPFFGLQPPGLDGHGEPLTSVADLAAYFVAQIRAFHPGPCVVAGFCAGGTIAFEVARQLRQEGATIGFVALFACPHPDWFGWRPQLRERLAQRAGRARAHARALASRSPGEGRRYMMDLLRAWRSRRRAGPAVAADPVLVRRARVERVTLAAVRAYTPAYFEGLLSLFQPGRDWLRPAYAARRWRSLARDTEEYFGPEGGNRDVMLLEPYVEAIAELFRRCQAKRAGWR